MNGRKLDAIIVDEAVDITTEQIHNFMARYRYMPQNIGAEVTAVLFTGENVQEVANTFPELKVSYQRANSKGYTSVIGMKVLGTEDEVEVYKNHYLIKVSWPVNVGPTPKSNPYYVMAKFEFERDHFKTWDL